jgi:hypothetical protein
MTKQTEEFSPNEIADRMKNAVRRALTTPPTPTKALVGKTERAQSQRESRKLRISRGKSHPDPK